MIHSYKISKDVTVYNRIVIDDCFLICVAKRIINIGFKQATCIFLIKEKNTKAFELFKLVSNIEGAIATADLVLISFNNINYYEIHEFKKHLSDYIIDMYNGCNNNNKKIIVEESEVKVSDRSIKNRVLNFLSDGYIPNIIFITWFIVIVTITLMVLLHD